MLRRFGAVVSFGCAAVIVSGCGAGGSTSSATIPQTASKAHSASPARSTKTRLTLKVPVRHIAATANRLRKPQYLSPATSELSVRTGIYSSAGIQSPWQEFDISSTSAANVCGQPINGFRTCVVTVNAPVSAAPDQDEFQVVATDSATSATDTYPQGNYLSAGDDIETIAAGTTVGVNLTLNAFINSFATCAAAQTAACAAPASSAVAAYSVWAAPGTSANVPVDISAFDFDGNLIVDSVSQSFHQAMTFCDSLGGASLPSTCAIVPASSPFTYSGGLGSTATGLVPAEITYLAPMTGSSASTTVTLDAPNSWNSTGAIPLNFTLTPMVVSDTTGTPIASVPALSISGSNGATDATITVTEVGASSFTVSANAAGAVTLLSAAGGAPLSSSVTATAGTITFDVHAVSVTNATATITITDASGTVATLPVKVAL